MITYGEFEEMKRSAEEEVGDAANAVIATLQSGECVVGHILEEMSATTPGNGRMLATSRRRRRRSLKDAYSDAEYQSAMSVMEAMLYDAMFAYVVSSDGSMTRRGAGVISAMEDLSKRAQNLELL